MNTRPLSRRLSSALAVIALLAWGSIGSAQTVAESIGEKVVRFYESNESRAAAGPSLALESPRPALGAAPAGFAIKPVFGDTKGRKSASIPVEAGTSCYGTGEVAGPLLRNGRKIVCWNTDAYGYDENSLSLYKSHPWVLAVRADGTAFGVLADTTWRCEVDLTGVGSMGGEMVFVADGPAFPLIVIDRATPQEVVTALADLTGKIAMPPRWAVGYHQCRYSYYPDTRVMEIAKGFRERRIPCDVIWHDIDYMDRFFCFTFDKKSFPDPARHNADLHALGFRTIWMIDPGIGADESKLPAGGYPVYEQGTKGDDWVHRADGSVYRGEVWPGWCVFPDYTRAKTRAWWAGLYRDFMATGVDGVWNDMNEPAVFNVASKTMPEDNVHRADADLGGQGPHAKYHNVYGMLMVKASREGIMAANPDKRPFVLSRAGYMGSHRYAASWTGDNTASWSHLEMSIPMTLNLGLSGQPFAGPDIGGFVGNGPPGAEGALFARWMGFGALLPFSRGHTGKENMNKEPWAFGPEVEKTCRSAIERRYRLLPYLYTLFHESATSGLPVGRPVFFADPRDPALRSEDDSFLLGGDLLVSCQVVPDRSRAAVMPKGDWKMLRLESPNPDLPDLYIRPGAIVPTGPVMQYSGEKPLDPLILCVHLDVRGRAEGSLYEDSGEGLGYQKGEFLLTRYGAERKGDELTFSVLSTEGRMARPARTVVYTVLLGDEVLAVQSKDGDTVTVRISEAQRSEPPK